MKNIKLLILFVLFGTFVYGQHFLPSIVNYTPKEYGNEELLTAENYSITQDDKGMMYFGNSNCILVYDGISWKNISTPQLTAIRALKISDNRIYCGAFNQFGYLEADKAGKYSYRSLSDSLMIDFADVWKIHIIGDLVYYQTEQGIFIYDQQEVVSIIPESSFHLSFSVGDRLFVRQRGIGIQEVVGKELKTIVNSDALYGVFAVLEDGDDYLFVTQEFGLWKYSEQNKGELQPVSEDSCVNLRYRNIIGGVTIREGLHALYSTSDGLLLVNNHGELLDNITRESGLVSSDIKEAYRDVHGNLWLATGGGIIRMNVSSPISYFKEANGIIGNVQAVETFKGKKWIGTSLGLLIEGKHVNRFERTFIHEQTWDFEKIDSTQMFIATASGLYYIHKDDMIKIDTEGSNALYYDKENNFLISAGDKGINIFDGYSNWGIMKRFPLGMGRVTGISKHPKTQEYWIGTQTVGAIRLYFDGFEFNIDVFGENDGLHAGKLITPFSGSEQIYFGTPHGLLEFVDEEEVKKSLSEEELQNPDNYRGYFTESHLFALEAGHNYSQMLFAGDLAFACIDNKLVLFAEGQRFEKIFQSVEIGRINKLKLIEDELYVGGAEGLLIINVQSVLSVINNPGKKSFNTIIRNVSYRDSVLYYGFVGQQLVNQLEYYRNNIAFDCAASFYEGTHQPLFKWRLLGDHDEWSKWTNNPRAEFSNLHEGKYEFQVVAKNVFDDEGEMASYQIEVLTPWFRSIWAYVSYVLLFIVIVYIAIELGRKRLKKQNIWLESVVEERTAEIKDKNKELEHSYHEIAEQKQEITDSINYAKRIQEAVLPLSVEIKRHVPEYFVLFMPKDIVSGDFYWFHHIDGESVFVCADCTGHGVPGAFMSMVGSDKLNRAVIEEKQTDPAKILSHLNKGIKRALKQNEDDEQATRDGMDASIISIDLEQRLLKYAGAHRPLFLIRDGEISETKATKVAVGGFTSDDQEFELNEFNLLEGDCFYMTSDGYPDQFGGERGKKFKMKAFKDLLIEIHSKPMEHQKEILQQTIVDWMGEEYEQIDDICVIGVRV